MIHQRILSSTQRIPSDHPPAETTRRPAVLQRLASVDAFRGLVLFLMVAEIFLQLHEVAKARPESGLWRFLGQLQEHVIWSGAHLHDMIHPSFTFLVGVALPFSLAHRLARGETNWRLIGHAAWRSLLLIALGVFSRSVGKPRTFFIFTDTLAQIGLGYFPLFLVGMAMYHPTMAKRWRPAFRAALPWIVLLVILVGDWAAFALYPLPGPNFNYQAVHVPADWQHFFTGFAAHWNKGSNLGTAFDQWFLNLFPQYDGRPWVAHPGGYSTLNFIPHLGTMLLGLIAGAWLKGLYSHLRENADAANGTEDHYRKAGEIGVRKREETIDPRTPRELILRLLAAGIACLALGLVLNHLGVCPIVKRLWTPAWVLYSGGWCFLVLGVFYYIMDVRLWQSWAFPLTVLGVNSIAVYVLSDLSASFLLDASQTHLGFAISYFGKAYEAPLRGLPALVAFWLFFYWLYRRHIYIKL